jgi:excisionase family DNA binding protein
MGGAVSLLDELALRELIAEATEQAIRKVLRERPAQPDASRQWASTAQLAAQYSMAQSTIRTWVRQGKIRSIRVGGALRVSVEDFERMLSAPPTSLGRKVCPEELADQDAERERRSRRG